MGMSTKKVSFNYSKLKGRIVECGLTKRDVATAAGMSNVTFSEKLRGNYEFSQSEITAISDLLRIDKDDLATYFFAQEV